MILLDYKDSRPIYEQELMFLGVLEEDDQMPSVRSLAMELSINPNTIQRAYGELERQGYIYMVKGRGSFVGSIRRLKEARREKLAGSMRELAKEAVSLDMDCETFVNLARKEYGRTAEENREEQSV